MKRGEPYGIQTIVVSQATTEGTAVCAKVDALHRMYGTRPYMYPTYVEYVKIEHEYVHSGGIHVSRKTPPSSLLHLLLH